MIYTDQSGMWRIQCVPINPKSFENRLSLPEAWRGVRDSALDEVSKISGCTFVHSGGFIGATVDYEKLLPGLKLTLDSSFQPNTGVKAGKFKTENKHVDIFRNVQFLAPTVTQEMLPQ